MRRIHVPAAAGDLWDVAARGDGLWVVGAARRPGQAFSMRWTGTHWNVVRTPEAGGFLVTVASQAGGDLWAANYDTIYRRVNGRWGPGRRLPRGTSVLSLTFPSRTDGWAVGGGPTGGEWERPFAMRRHGSPWAGAPFPQPEGSSTLTAVDGTPHDVWAVGYRAGYSGPAFAYHYC
jgi:hypothetical protein